MQKRPATLLTFALLIFGFWGISSAQEEDSTRFRLEDLRTPTSPAFTLIGKAPASIARPRTPRAFAFDLVNQLGTAEGLPKDGAIEVAPYWLLAHPGLSFGDYFNPGFFRGLLHNFSASVAAGPVPEGNGTMLVSMGVRTMVLQGRPADAPDGRDYLTFLSERQFLMSLPMLLRFPLLDMLPDTIQTAAQLRRRLDTVFEQIRNKLIANEDTREELLVRLDDIKGDLNRALDAHGDDADPELAFARIFESLEKKAVSDLQELAVAFSRESKHRRGFQLELASAIAGIYPKNTVDTGEITRIGAWLTALYPTQNNDWMVTARLLHDPRVERNAMDVGLRWMLNVQDFGLSLEALSRFDIDDTERNTERIALSLEYRMFEDNYLSGTFGKDFDDRNLLGEGNLIALMGLKFNLGKKPNLTPTP